jgi:hypothetical protein
MVDGRRSPTRPKPIGHTPRMLGHATPEEAAPDGGHVHEVYTVGNRETGEVIRWEQCRSCPRPQPTTTWTDEDGGRHILVDGAHIAIPIGQYLDYWWAEHAWHETDSTVTYVPVGFDEPRPTNLPYALNWEERDQWLHFVAGEPWEPGMTEDEWLDMLRPLEPDDEGDQDEADPPADDADG